MSKKGCSCEEPDLVPVNDRNLSLGYVSGNKYSRFCRTCGRRYFCTKSFWEKAAEKFIIPFESKEPVAAGEYDDENYFECPQCGKPHFGYPVDCDDCGVAFGWDVDERGDD